MWGNNARFMPPFQGHFDAPYEEPWLGMRQGRQQGQQGQQAQLEPHFGRADQAIGERAKELSRTSTIEILIGKNQDPPPKATKEGKQGSREQWSLNFPRFKGDDDALDMVSKSCEHDLGCWDNFARAIQLRLAVKMQGPRNLGEAYALAKIQEEYLATVKRSKRPTYEPTEAHGSSHKPNKGQLRLRKSGDSKQFSARTFYVSAKVNTYANVRRGGRRVCATIVMRDGVQITGARIGNYILLKKWKMKRPNCTSPSTMRVIAIVNGQTTVVLLDTGSTHNFMDETLAKTLKLPIDGESNFGVRVANGQVIRTLSECKKVKFKMQGLHLKLTFNLLELGGYGIVLGKKVWLQGLKEKPNLIQGSKDFKGKATMKGLLFQIMPCELASIQEEIGAPIREIVEEFPQVFEELEGRGSPVVWTLWKDYSLLASKRCSSYMGALVQAPRRLPTPCGQGVLDGGGNVKTPTIPHPRESVCFRERKQEVPFTLSLFFAEDWCSIY
uniref:Uncharacterized protein n=1 Tax=Fagus sylvatica TaxID=28930 RepID=A0A2N9ISR3_FAGSY